MRFASALGVVATLAHALPVVAVPELSALSDWRDVVHHFCQASTVHARRMLLDVRQPCTPPSS